MFYLFMKVNDKSFLNKEEKKRQYHIKPTSISSRAIVQCDKIQGVEERKENGIAESIILQGSVLKGRHVISGVLIGGS